MKYPKYHTRKYWHLNCDVGDKVFYLDHWWWVVKRLGDMVFLRREANKKVYFLGV